MRRLTKIAKKILVVCTFFVPVLLVNSVSAISSEEIFTKILLNNTNKCYEHALVDSIEFNSYNKFDSLMNLGYKQASSSEGAGSPTAEDSSVFYIPALDDEEFNMIKEVDTISGGRVASCYALFNGDSYGSGFDGWMKGLFEIYGKDKIYDIALRNESADVGIDRMNNFMGDLMKYSIKTEEVSKTEYCYTVYVKETTLAADPVNLGSVCINGDNYPLKDSSGMSIIGGESGTGYSLSIGWMDGNANLYIQENSFYAVVTSENDMCKTTINYLPGGQARCQAYVDLGKEKPTAGKIVLDSNNVGEFPSKGGDYRMTWGDMPTIYVEIEERTGTGEGSKKVLYEKPSGSARMFIKGLLENSDLGSIEFTDAEKYDLYLQYLKNYYGKKDTPISSNKCQPNRPSPIGYYIFSKGKGWCLANVDEYKINDKHKMTVFRNNDATSDRVLIGVIDNLPDLIRIMADLDYGNEDSFTDIDDAGQSEGGIVVDPDNPDIEEGDVCYTGAGALGWILCPVTSGLTSLGGEAYEWIQENFLQVRSEIFSDDDNGVRTAWDTIRNIANVGFVILLLIVIVSQLTGFGIDNYGIKRILPKLIIGAILMNLSYIICELLIDVSNIAGSGLKDLLESMGPKLSRSAIAYEASGGQYAAVFGTGIVAVAIGMILSSGGVGAILMVFVALIAVVISILVLLVILVVRQAGVVVCVIIAPIAVMCYLLPNTEKYFKKWISLMKGLLLVYPLCGLVIGAGNLVGKIFGNLAASPSTDFQTGFALSAMVVTAVPYLFIPTLLKSSLAAMGNIGAKISGIGNQLRSGASKKINNSDAMKASRQRAADSRMMRKAGYSEKRGGLTTRGKIKAKFAKTKVAGALGYTRMQNARIQAAEKIADANKEARAVLSSETAAADIAEYMANTGKTTNDYFQEQIDNAGGDIRKLDATILTAQKRGLKNKDIAAMIRKAQNSGKLKFADDISRANWMNSMLKNHGDVVSTDYDMQEWMKDGGKGALGDYGEYAAAHRSISDIDINDLSKMSGDSLAGAIKAGLVSAPVAQQWLAANPNQSADKKVMMGAVASGIVDANSLKSISANDFKREAQSLLDGGKTTATTSAIRNGAGTKDIDDLVASWTTTAQTRVYISQDSSVMKDEQKQRDPVLVRFSQDGSDGTFDVRSQLPPTELPPPNLPPTELPPPNLPPQSTPPQPAPPQSSQPGNNA